MTLIGADNCVVFDSPEKTADVQKTLEAMKSTLEKNGKPSAINLITDNDNRFLRRIDRQARREAAAQASERLGTANPEEEKSQQLDQTNLTEEEKAARAEELKRAEISESEEDEVGALIEREE